MQALNADTTIYIVSMPVNFSPRAKRGKLRTGPSLTNETISKFDQGLPGVGWEVGSYIASFFSGADPASAPVAHALTPLVHPSPGADDRSMDEEKMHGDHSVMIKTEATPSGEGSGHRRWSTPETESRGGLIPLGLVSTVFKGASTSATCRGVSSR